MHRGLVTAVVIPAFNEERAIAAAIRTVPSFVDHVIVVDDASRDATSARAQAAARAGLVEIIRHGSNRGVGAAIITGYRRALALGVDAVAVMAGDGQMDPGDLPALLAPIAEGRADYAKGNRFAHPDVWRAMPTARIAGNLALSLATRVTSGYRGLFDSQCGYTAISRAALERVDLERVFGRYGYPNDLLARLHAVGARVVDVPVRPIYGAGWKSGIRLHTVVYPIAYVLVRSWALRVGAEAAAARSLADGPAAAAAERRPPERFSMARADRDRARRGESGRTPEAQRGAWLLHVTSEHRTYARSHPDRDGRRPRGLLRRALGRAA